jgi:hypothetical protein
MWLTPEPYLRIPTAPDNSDPFGSQSSPSASTGMDFQNVALSPRTPRFPLTPRFTPQTPRSTVYRKFEAGLDGLGEEEDEAELRLLGEDERRQYAEGLDDGFGSITRTHPGPVSAEDKRAMVLLVVLCTLFSRQATPHSLACRPDPGCSGMFLGSA